METEETSQDITEIPNESQSALTAEQQTEVTEVLKSFNKKGDDIMTKHEVYTALCRLRQSPTKDEMEGILMDLRVTENGLVDIKEFRNYLNENGLKTEDDLTEILVDAFCDIDRTNQGQIHKDELVKVLSTLGDSELSKAEIDELVKTAEPDEDGFIDYREFTKTLILE